MRLGLVSILFLFAQFLFSQSELLSRTEVVKLMGSRFEFTAIGESLEDCDLAIKKAIDEVDRLEKIISSWDPNSQTSEIVINAGIKPVKVELELFNLIERSIKVSEITEGAFDISFASIDPIWKFEGQEEVMPDSSRIKKSVSKIDHKKIHLNKNDTTVFLMERGMKIGFGGIGKGLAAANAARFMRKMGIESGIVNAGGDLYAWGRDENGRPWKIGVTDPNDKTKTLAWLDIEDMAIVTSGDYERFLTIDGKRYAHIIDPRTGWPASGIKSVSVLCPDPELADALATSIFVMGEENGLYLINQLKGVECLIINDENEIVHSKHLNLNYYGAKKSDRHATKIGY